MKRMKRFLILMLALAMLTGCAAGTAPEEPAATPAAPAPAPEDGTAPPAPTIEVAAESSAPDPWALWDGERLFYVGNDGLHRREGEQDTVVDAGESRQYLGLYKLEDGGYVADTPGFSTFEIERYRLTEKGRAMLAQEYRRICAQAEDYRRIFGEEAVT